MEALPILTFVAGAVISGVITWLVVRNKLTELNTRIEGERKAAGEKLETLADAQKQLSNAFRALSAEALQSNNQVFLDLAKTTLEKFQESAKGDLDSRQKAIDELIKPIKESMGKVDNQLKEMEKVRLTAYTSLTEHVKFLATAHSELQSETANLVTALRAPTVRGRWGEIQLKRVVEIANMLPYCDFVEQPSVTTDDGRLRPDLIVKLPGGKNIVVDAKTPLGAYLNALEAKDEDVRMIHLKHHAKQVHDHMNKLSSKSYWEQFKPNPEFVFMFLPGESFFSAALEQNPSLIEMGAKLNVILATPTTLIALLKAVAYGWQQEKVAESAHLVSELGKELYDRLCTMGGHIEGVGKGLNSAVEAYNKAVGSMESRVLVSARKFSELGVAGKKDIPELAPLEKTSRPLSAPEFAALPGAASKPSEESEK